MLSECQSAYVTRYITSYTSGPDLCIAMEYLGGGSVHDLIETAPLEESFVAIITRELLKACDYLHSNGKIHRDIKSVICFALLCALFFVLFLLLSSPPLRLLLLATLRTMISGFGTVRLGGLSPSLSVLLSLPSSLPSPLPSRVAGAPTCSSAPRATSRYRISA